MNLDELKNLSQATLQGIRGADTNAGTSDSVVNEFARASFIPATQGGNIGAAANSTAAAEEERARAARAAEMESIKRKLDPAQYQVRRKDDGGFDFFDPDGQAIDISRYAEVTGQRPADILKYSDNPLDRQYINDYESMKSVIDAVQMGDTDTLQSLLKNNSSIDIKQKPEDLMRELISRYPHIYGIGKYQDTLRNNGNSLFKFNLGGSSSGQSGISSSDYGY